ncbi:MAG TPA: hypothetical protein VJN94_02290 [Candidatus Binataceae bacterium]|nr:hypothetical protein [Candidatus Binataceae bacterium]
MVENDAPVAFRQTEQWQVVSARTFSISNLIAPQRQLPLTIAALSISLGKQLQQPMNIVNFFSAVRLEQ